MHNESLQASVHRLHEYGEEPITLDEAKAHLRVTHERDDAWIGSRITQARAWAETYLGRTIRAAQLELRLKRFPGARWSDRLPVITLPAPPTVSVTEIAYMDPTGGWVSLAASQYQMDTAREPALIAPALDTSWPATRLDALYAVRVVYNAGFTDPALVPGVFVFAMLMMLGHWYEHREAVSDFQVFDVPKGAEWLLDPHRLINV